MSGDHFPAGPRIHAESDYLPDDLMGAVEKNIAYACTDVALRNPDTGEIFLGTRQTEPQLGPWLVGGRNKYGLGIDENAALQVEKDLGLKEISPSRFKFIATYSTTFPAASPNRQDHGRHTVNSTMLLDLKTEEIDELNAKLGNGEIRDEYSSGHWYKPDDISSPGSDFPDALRQFVRDLKKYDRSYQADWDEAIQENTHRRIHGSPEDAEKEVLIKADRLSKSYGLTDDEAYKITTASGANAEYAILWARTVNEQAENLKEVISSILAADEYMGDYKVRKTFTGLGISPPEVMSDNGPAMRAILKGALLALEANENHEGKIFENLSKIRFLGRAGVGPMDPQ